MIEGESINRKTFQAYFLWAWHDYTEWLKDIPRHPMDKLLKKHGLPMDSVSLTPTFEGFMQYLAGQEYGE